MWIKAVGNPVPVTLLIRPDISRKLGILLFLNDHPF
jgi:hypothetical protein